MNSGQFLRSSARLSELFKNNLNGTSEFSKYARRLLRVLSIASGYRTPQTANKGLKLAGNCAQILIRN